MAQDILVREADASNIPKLIEYNIALADETENVSLDTDILRLGITRALELKDCHYFVAQMDEKIVGQTMVTSEWSDWRNGVMWWMQSVYVHPDYRKRGVFKSLFKHIETLATKNPQVKGIRLYVMRDNQAGRSAYQNLGMNDSGYIVYEKSA